MEGVSPSRAPLCTGGRIGDEAVLQVARVASRANLTLVYLANDGGIAPHDWREPARFDTSLVEAGGSVGLAERCGGYTQHHHLIF